MGALLVRVELVVLVSDAQPAQVGGAVLVGLCALPALLLRLRLLCASLQPPSPPPSRVDCARPRRLLHRLSGSSAAQASDGAESRAEATRACLRRDELVAQVSQGDGDVLVLGGFERRSAEDLWYLLRLLCRCSFSAEAGPSALAAHWSAATRQRLAAHGGR